MSAGLTTAEWSAIDRFVERVASIVGGDLVATWLYGSAARSDMWGEFWPMRSDIDLLVVTASGPHPMWAESVRAATYETFLSERAPL